MRETSSCCPDAEAYNTPIDACAGRSLHDSDMVRLEEMVNAGIPLTAATMVSVMRLAGPDNLDRSEWQAELLSQRHGITPDKPLYDRLILVGTVAKQWKRSLHILERKASASVSPGPNICTRLNKSGLQSSKVRDAVDMVRFMGPAWVSRAECQLASCLRHEHRLCCSGPPSSGQSPE